MIPDYNLAGRMIKELLPLEDHDKMKEVREPPEWDIPVQTDCLQFNNTVLGAIR